MIVLCFYIQPDSIVCVCKLAGVHELAALLCQGMSAVFSLNKRFQKGVLKRLLISAGGGGGG